MARAVPRGEKAASWRGGKAARRAARPERGGPGGGLCPRLRRPKAAEEKKAQQGFSVDPLDFHLPHEEPPAPPMEEPKEDEDKQDPSGPADL